VVPIQSPIGAVDENASFEWEYTGAL